MQSLYKNTKEIIIFFVATIAILFILVGVARGPKSTPVFVQSSTSFDSFVGMWIRDDSTNFTHATLTISNPGLRSFAFAVDASDGADSGSWSNYDSETQSYTGTMSRSGNVVHYVESECTADFVLSRDGMTLDVDTDCDRTYAGYGVSFSGTFHKNSTIKKVTMNATQIFATHSEAYSSFAKMVGKYLPLFEQTIANETYVTYQDHELGLVASSSFVVPHARTQVESIVILGPKDALWAAVIDWDEKTAKPSVLYFTNQKKWRASMPGMIGEWMSSFGSYPVVYVSK